MTAHPEESAQLKISVGQATTSGVKPINEDCMGVQIPQHRQKITKGIASVIADGVSAASGGKIAAEMCVQAFLADYYSTPDTYAVKTAGQRVLNALNQWLYAQGQREGHKVERGYLSTLSALILHSTTAHIFHIGDTRIYRLRENAWELITRDHSTSVSSSTNYLNRAMGLNLSPKVDYHDLDLEVGDLFVCTSDGVHEWLSDSEFKYYLEEKNLDAAATNIVSKALANGSLDNLTCQIIQVEELPAQQKEEMTRLLEQRPFPPLLKPKTLLDGLEVTAILYESARSQLYAVRDTVTGKSMVMKTPSPNFQDDSDYINGFINEEWIGKRVSHPGLIEVLEPRETPTMLYYLMEKIEGQTLSQWTKARGESIEIQQLIDIAEQLISATRALHRMETLHQDLKLDNIMIQPNGKIMIIDYGSCKIASLADSRSTLQAPGTLEFGAPEYRYPQGGAIGGHSDQFSIAMILYYLFTRGQSPYGEAWKSATSSHDFSLLSYTPSYHHQPLVPVWLDGALKKALSISPESRYASMSEFVHDLKHPNPAFTEAKFLPLKERDPLRFWQSLCAIFFITTLLFLFLFLTKAS